jgi:hypothetical protein
MVNILLRNVCGIKCLYVKFKRSRLSDTGASSSWTSSLSTVSVVAVNASGLGSTATVLLVVGLIVLLGLLCALITWLVVRRRTAHVSAQNGAVIECFFYNFLIFYAVSNSPSSIVDTNSVDDNEMVSAGYIHEQDSLVARDALSGQRASAAASSNYANIAAVDVAARASLHYSSALEAQYAEVSVVAAGLQQLNQDALNRGYVIDPKVSY